MAKFARSNLKHVLEIHIFQNGTLCQSEKCFRLAHVPKRRATQAPFTEVFAFETGLPGCHTKDTGGRMCTIGTLWFRDYGCLKINAYQLSMTIKRCLNFT